MDRDGKGKSANKHVDNYCVVDLETTGVFVRSAKIIEISAIKVRDNEVVGEFSTLINPNCLIPAKATEINHITNEMVSSAPCLEDIIDEFTEFIGDDVIVGYNNAGFDMNIIYDSLKSIRGIQFTNNYIDVLHSARRCLVELENYKLETVSRHYQLDVTGEHRALKDCYLTKDCYDRLYEEFGETAFIGQRARGFESNRSYSQRVSAETQALQELQDLLQAIVSDKQVTMDELLGLINWTENHRDLQGNYPFDRVFDAVDSVLADGEVMPEELEDLQDMFVGFLDPVKTNSCHEEIFSVEGKHICVTGDFDYGSREQVFSIIEEAGGIIDKSVKKATNYVVVGAKGSDSWRAGNYGAKILKALEMNDKGGSIIIVEEGDFIPCLEHILEDKKNRGTEEKTDQLHFDWKQEVRKMLSELIDQYQLPKGSLYLSDSYSQTGKLEGQLISHSVYIWEPVYPPRQDEKPGQNRLVLTVFPSKAQSRAHDLDLMIREPQENDLRNCLPNDAIILKRIKSDIDTGMTRIRMRDDSVNLPGYIKENTIYCLDRYESKANRFGCCSRFEQCSEQGECIHPNRLYSSACMYRENLEQGRIFYGERRGTEGMSKVIEQKVMIDNEMVVLSSAKLYSGLENPNDEEKLVRKAVGLPVKKQLVYYKNKRDVDSIVNVTNYRLIEMYEVTDRWYTVEITTADGDLVKIHSSYLAEMQRPSFISDLEAQSV